MIELIQQRLRESIAVKELVISNQELTEAIASLSCEIKTTLLNGGKLILCGNGGSASDALHMAGEIVGRFQKEREPWPAIVLNADTATMTAISNDYGYDNIYSRQVKGFMTDKDMLLGISTSGNSENIYQAIKEAGRIGGKTAALLGRDGGKIKECVDYPIVVPCSVTARIQECHITIIHILCELIELDN